MKQFNPLVMEKFTITPAVSELAVVLRWQGEMTLRDPASALTPYLDACLESSEGKCLVLDFTKMSFMNSSSLIPIIALIKKLGSRSQPGELRYSEAIAWQRVSYHSMTILCLRTPTVKVAYG